MKELKEVLYLTGLVLVDIQIGRKVYRQRLEVGDRDADIEQRRVSWFPIIITVRWQYLSVFK